MESRRTLETKILTDIFNDASDAINADLFNIYKSDYFKGIDQVFGETSPYTTNDKLKQQFRLNMSKFAAAKTYQQTQELTELANSFDTEGDFTAQAKPVMNKYRRWQAVESHTMTARCRTAKQFSKFLDEDAPNIEWLMTRSAHPREAHLAFVGKILPKDHPFWIDNQPGNLYECKCDWRTTYEEPTEAPTDEVTPPAGLEGNPAFSREIFTENHPYIKKLSRKGRKALEEFTYDDDGLIISVLADKVEIMENVLTGRLLLNYYKKVLIRKDLSGKQKGVKNPEFEIDGMIADAKRIKRTKNINKNFSRAFNNQKCQMCIIDFNMHYDTSKIINADQLCGKIMNRYRDIENNKKIVIVHGREAVEINKNNFKKHLVTKLIKGIMPKP